MTTMASRGSSALFFFLIFFSPWGIAAGQEVQVLEFALRLKGACANSGQCTATAGSQTIDTTVTDSAEGVYFKVVTTGSMVQLNFSLADMTPGTGRISFGTAGNHTLSLHSHPGVAVMPAEIDGTYVIGGTYIVLGGSGVFQDAYGMVSYAHTFNSFTGAGATFLYGRPFVLHFEEAKQFEKVWRPTLEVLRLSSSRVAMP